MSSFFRTLPDTLQQPAALAMLGSVGAHLLFFATLPAFTNSTEPRPESEVRRVRLLEPPQGRPNSQIARSQIGLPPLPNTPNSRIQLPTAGSGNSPVPNPLYTIPDLTPVPVPNTPAPQSSVDRFNELLRRLRERQLQQAQQNRPIKPPPPPASPSPSPSPAPTIATGTNLKPFDPRDLDKTTGTPSTESAPLPTPTGTPQPAPTTPAPRIDQAQIDRNTQLLAALRFNPAGTTDQERGQIVQNTAQQLAKQFPDWTYVPLREPGEKPKEIDFPLTFTPSDFNEHPPRPISIAILIGRDGKPLPDQKPIVLSSTGYQILNEKAIEYVQKDASQPDRFAPIDKDQVRAVVYDLQFKLPNAQPTS